MTPVRTLTLSLALVTLAALPPVLHAAEAQTTQTVAAPMISASSATASQTVAELRAETRALQARIKELRAAQQIDKAIQQRDKARAALAALLAKEISK